MKYLLLIFSIFSFAQTQKFIPIDEETLEFIDEVNYTLYYQDKVVYNNVSSNDSITLLPKNIVFDSISFTKENYKEKGLKKENLREVVLLSKKVYELDEVVLFNTKKQEFIIGEQSRFIKRRSRPILQDTNFGLLFRVIDLQDYVLHNMMFYVEKVKYKTTYKIKFFEAEELGNPLNGRQTLQLKELLFETPVLTLERGTKNEVEVNLDSYDLSNLVGKNIFVTIELENYYDENDSIIEPDIKSRTKIKQQLSKRLDSYSKMSDIYTKESSKDFYNTNAMINYDFAINYWGKPHKSNLVAPAIISATKEPKKEQPEPVLIQKPIKL